MLQLQYLQIFHVWGCISLCSFTFRGVWSVREAGTVSRGNWIKSVKILRSFLVDSCVQGASVPLSPPCIFHHTLPFFFILFSFSLPSKLPCGTCWHCISQPCTQSPLVLSVLELEHVCVCVYAMCLCTHTCETEDLVGDVVLTQSPPSFPFSHAQITLYVIPQSHRQKKNRGRERALTESLFSKLAAPKLQNSWDSLYRKDLLKLFWAEIQISFCFGPKQWTKLPGWDQ